LEHAPTFRIVARFTGNTAVAGAEAVRAESIVPVEITTGAEHSYAELMSSLNRIGVVLADENPQASSEVDLKLGAIVITAPSSVSTADVARYEAFVGVPVRSRAADGPITRLVGATYGGMKIRFDPAGSTYSLCTTGFTVRNASGVKGVTSAAHCGDDDGGDQNLTYYDGYNNTSYRVYLRFTRNDNDQDIMWASDTLHPVFPRFWIGTNLRDVTSVVTSGMLGDYVCHYGYYTGNSCGTVVSEFFDPGNICGTTGHGDCLAAWIKVTGSQLACGHGDSGGPLYANEAAFGVLQAGLYTGNQKGQCSVATFMRMDRFPTSVLLAP
jgi:hypothetical protein